MRKLLAIPAAGLLVAGAVIAAPAHAGAAQLPCDIYAAAGTPCVAANSTTRALYAAYNGPLYTVTRASDGRTWTVNTVSAGGVANAAVQDAFCAGTTCRITDIADQTPYNNDLAVAPKAGNGGPYHGAVANALPVQVDGARVYAVVGGPGVGYADDDTWNIPLGPQGEYMRTGGGNYGCCFDYGNAETDLKDDGNGAMDAVSFGGGNRVGVDLENGIYGSIPSAGNAFSFTTASRWTVGDGVNWQTGRLPYPLRLQGGMVLGIGGDGSNTATGNFYEGIITNGAPTKAADAAVAANANQAYGN